MSPPRCWLSFDWGRLQNGLCGSARQIGELPCNTTPEGIVSTKMRPNMQPQRKVSRCLCLTFMLVSTLILSCGPQALCRSRQMSFMVVSLGLRLVFQSSFGLDLVTGFKAVFCFEVVGFHWGQASRLEAESLSGKTADLFTLNHKPEHLKHLNPPALRPKFIPPPPEKKKREVFSPCQLESPTPRRPRKSS